MRVRTVALLAGLGMMLSSVSVWSLTEPAKRTERWQSRYGEREVSTDPSVKVASTRSVQLEGRPGHAEVASGRESETFALFTVTGTDEGNGEKRAAMHLVIAIDRSGSMAGKRLDNALAAARGAVARLNDEDMVSVVEYATDARLLVAPTTLSPGNRERVLQSIAGITSGGDTCISCALRKGIEALGGQRGMVDRVLLLSDGEPTTGARDVEGLRLIADDVRRAGASVTTVGVDVDYNERIMAAIARESNGRHYFVENPSGLSAIFDAELEGLGKTVAREATLTLEPAPGVELVEVMDRSFRRDGDRLVVSLGTVAGGERKEVLVRARMRSPERGQRELVSAHLAFEDVQSGKNSDLDDRLVVAIVDRPKSDALDPLVEERVRRSSTVGVLTEANRLFEQGDKDEAKRKVEEALGATQASRQRAVAAAPAAAKPAIEREFARQEAALDTAAQGFAVAPEAAGAPAAASKAGRAAVRQNQAAASRMAGF